MIFSIWNFCSFLIGFISFRSELKDQNNFQKQVIVVGTFISLDADIFQTLEFCPSRSFDYF